MRNNSQQGFTLLEILIAMLVIAVGVLGHAKMQVKSMDVAQRSGFAQTANIALLDLAQRIRINRDAALNGEFDFNNLIVGSTSSSSIAPTARVNCADADCTRAEFAEYELKEWFDELDTQLSEPRFSVATAGDLIIIFLVWDAARSGVAQGTADANHQKSELTVWLR